jgi:enoyl-[acyl-carrier protein] reductase I
MKSEPFVRPIAEKLGTDIVLPLNVRESGQFGQLFDSIRQIWGQVDICLHSIPVCPKDDLHARVVDCSRDGFITAMDISVYSFIRMVRRAAPLAPRRWSNATTSWVRSKPRSLANVGFWGQSSAGPFDQWPRL